MNPVPLACAQNSAHFRLQRGNVRLQNTPDDIEVDAELVVDQPIPHPGHRTPLHRGVRVAHRCRQSLRRLADDLKTPNNGALQDGIAEVDKVRARPLLGLKLDKQVNVNIRTCGVPADRPEQRQAPHAQPENLGLDSLQASLHIGAGGGASAIMAHI